MLVRSIKVKPKDSVWIPGDWHFDEHDPEASLLFLRVVKSDPSNHFVLVGDTFESAGISRHARPSRKFRLSHGTINSERKAATPYLESIREIIEEFRGGPGGLHCLTGNHENWWQGVQDEFPGLEDTPWFELYGDLFNGWQIHREYTSLRMGPLLICHGHRLRGALSRYSAASVLANYPGQNTLYGHTHRIDTFSRPTFKYGVAQDHGAWTIGTLRSLESSYKDPFLGPHAESHQQGFARVDFFDVGSELFFKVTQVTINRTSTGTPFCFYKGERFTL